MKNSKKPSRVEYTLFQDIIDTYRYPDGTLNKIAVFISTLALVLLLIMGYFLIDGINNLKGMNTVSASELTVDEIQDYITNSYLDAIDDYSNGDLDQEKAKEKILKFISEYIQSTNGFTSQQSEALNNIINDYLSSNEIFTTIDENKESIVTLTAVIDKKYEENRTYANEILNLLQSEIENNASLNKEHHDLLSEEIEKLRSYTMGQLSEDTSNLNSLINQLRRTYTNSLGAQDYVEGSTYIAGEYVLYDEHLYISLTDNNQAMPLDSNRWELTDLEKIISNLEKSTEEEMEMLHDELVFITDEIKAALANTDANLDSIYKELLSTTDILRQDQQSMYSDLSTTIDSTSNNLKENQESMYNELSDTISDTTNNLVNSQESIYNELSNTISDTTNNLVNSQESIYNELSNTISDNTANLKESQKSIYNELTDTTNNLRQGQEDANKEMQSIYNDLSKTTNDLRSNQQNTTKSINDTITKQGKDFQKQIDAINKKLSNNNKSFQFGYDPKTGSYGYIVNNQFRPW